MSPTLPAGVHARSGARFVLPLTLAFFVSLLASGCSVPHDIKFEQVQYTVPPLGVTGAQKSAVVAVIAPETLATKKTIKSWMTGYAHDWNAHPGLMLKDVVEIEFKQVFSNFDLRNTYAEPASGEPRVTVELSLAKYDFAQFRAYVDLKAVVYGPGKTRLFEKIYKAEGDTQGAKMYWGGPFAMKSAIRQSSLDAFKKTFAELRADLANALQKPGA